MNTILMRTRLVQALLILSMLTLMTACGGGQVQDPENIPEVTRTIVLGVTSDAIQLSAMENSFANKLRTEAGVVCVVATGLPKLAAGVDPGSLRAAATDARASYVIINKMVPVSSDDSAGQSLDTYLRQAQADMSRDIGSEALIESRLFNIATGDLVWSDWSGVVNPKGRLQELAKASQKLGKKLARADILSD